ncbi:MAG: hypothetical protein AAF694_04740 [Bacteroidota bacterium]
MKDKVEFSPKELHLLEDRETLLLKKAILEKLEDLLGLLHLNLQDDLRKIDINFPSYMLKNPGKLSRGENYHYFPYRLLDFPAFFQKTDWVFYRTIIIWGHHISFNFMAQGDPLKQCLDKLVEIERARGHSIRIAKGKDPWIWVPEEGDEEAIDDLSIQGLRERIHSSGFLKLSAYLPLGEYHQVPEVGTRYWQLFREIFF